MCLACCACCSACMCCGKLTKWIVIGIIIFFVITAVVVPCVLLLGPDDTPLSTTIDPISSTSKLTDEFFIKDSIIFKAIENNIKSR
uniref:Uncharacterized protein n=1 Tax=Daphnia galeata TaxID=27404 RepID=A0A8J2RQU0_9CRUS|nr:unnamed protein product [Daphnia galeata]